MDRPPGTVRSRVAGGVAKLRARRAAGRQSGINNTHDVAAVRRALLSRQAQAAQRVIQGTAPDPAPRRRAVAARFG